MVVSVLQLVPEEAKEMGEKEEEPQTLSTCRTSKEGNRWVTLPDESGRGGSAGVAVTTSPTGARLAGQRQRAARKAGTRLGSSPRRYE